jgi:iron complex outermembrane receptor protein
VADAFRDEVVRRFGGCGAGCGISIGLVFAGLLATFATAAQDEPLETIAVSLPVEQAPPGRSEVSNAAVLEEVVVTAQRREEPLQDVPVSVSSFSAEQLQSAGVVSTSDLGRITPGLQFTDIMGASNIFMRGVGTDSFVLSADPSVATYVDGVYVPAQLGLLTTLGGVERIEVLKGPQGTLFGRNSTAGAINVVFKTPGAERELSMMAERRNFDGTLLQTYAATPIGDDFSVGAALQWVEQDSYFRMAGEPLGLLELPPPGGVPGDRIRAGRIKLRWTPRDDLDVVVAGFRTMMSGTSSTVAELRDPSLLATLLGIRAGQTDYELHRNEPIEAAVNHSSISADLRWQARLADVRLIAAYQKLVTVDGLIDYDYSRKDIISFNSGNSPTRQTTAELQFASNDASAWSDRLDWIAGLYYLHAQAGFDPVDAEFFGSGIPLPIINQMPGLQDLLSPLALSLQAAAYSVLETNSYSAYGQGTWHFDDRFSMTVGLRYQDESRFLIKQKTSVFSPLPDHTELTPLNFNAPEVWQDSTSQKLSLQWKTGVDSLLFVSYGKGVKSGTHNLGNLFVPPEYVQPERVQSYEIGLKSLLLDRSLRLNAALFWSEIEDPQTSFIAIFGSGSIMLENAGHARSRGAELELQALPMPRLDPGFSLKLSACLVDALYTDYRHASGYDPTTGLFRRNAFDLSGNQVPRSPRLSGNLGLVQNIEVGSNGEIEIGADVYYNGGFYYTSQNFESGQQKAYSLLNARIGYRYRPWGLGITAFGINLDDETYSYAGITADFGTAITLAPPRTYGLRLNLDF